jgi:hypothetical protein
MSKTMRCICCGSDQLTEMTYNNYGYQLLKGDENIFNNLSIYNCHNCGFSFSYPLIDKDDLINFYNSNYSAEQMLHAVSWENKFVYNKKRISPRYFCQLLLIGLFKNYETMHNILEIGPGGIKGYQTFRMMGNKAKYYVFEEDSTKYDIINKQNINILTPSSDSFFIKEYENSFDLTLMSHSLEHFQYNKILSIIDDICSMTAIGGVLMIEVPSENYLIDERDVNHSPHLCFFTIDSLRNLILKTKFDIIYIEECGPRKMNKAYSQQSSIVKDKLKTIWIIYSLVKLFKSLKTLFKIIIDNIYFNIFSNFDEILESEEYKYGKNRSSIRCLLKKVQD